jgi:hypothetical protein
MSDINYNLVLEILNFLEDKGWNELIDRRFTEDISEYIQKNFNYIDENTLKYVLKLIIF